MSVGIWAIERASDGFPIGLWVRSVDIEAHDGRGDVTFTSYPECALRFDDTTAAIACWRAQSETRPLRDDGKPNRPLCAFTVEIKPL